MRRIRSAARAAARLALIIAILLLTTRTKAMFFSAVLGAASTLWGLQNVDHRQAAVVILSILLALDVIAWGLDRPRPRRTHA